IHVAVRIQEHHATNILLIGDQRGRTASVARESRAQPGIARRSSVSVAVREPAIATTGLSAAPWVPAGTSRTSADARKTTWETNDSSAALAAIEAPPISERLFSGLHIE